MANETIHGRGAAHDPPNRFEPIAYEREAWSAAEDPAPETRFYRDATRSIIARNQSPDVGFETSVNPYRGCEHGCAYCIHGETPLLMSDGSQRPISDIRVGDEIYGTAREGWFRRYRPTTVLAHWESEKAAFRITLADGTELVASGDHRFLTLLGWKFVTGSEQGRQRRPHLTLNDSLLGTGGLSPSREETGDYRIGYLCGMIRGDSHVGAHAYMRDSGRAGRVHHFRLALVDDMALERTGRFLGGFGVETRRFLFSRGSETRKEVQAIRASSRAAFQRVTRLVRWPARPKDEWCRGFLAGIFDAEGSFSGGTLRIHNTDWAIVEEAVSAFGRFAFATTPEFRRLESGRPITCLRLTGGLREHLRFFHLTDPAIARKRNICGQALKSQADLRVASIEPVGRRTLYDIQTGTGDFISNGVVSHNCFARPTHEYFGLSAGLDFETKIFVKEDAPELLRRELESPKWEPQTVVMSGVTDPYQPVERRLGITRRCLEVLAEFRNPVAIITKSQLVTRDADYLGELAGYRAAVVNLSITSLRREIQRVMEPRAPSPERRLDAIRRLSEAGIPTSVMVAPVVPGLTDHEMPAILEAAAEAGAVRAGWVMLRLPWAVRELFEDWLERHFPDRKEKVLNRLRDLRGGDLYDSRWGVRQRGQGPFAEQVEQMFEVACRKAGLNQVSLELSTAAFRRPERGGQLGLFPEGA